MASGTFANNPWSGAALSPPPQNFGMLWPGAIDASAHAEQDLGPGRPSPASPPAENDFLGEPGEYIPPSGVVPSGLEFGNHDVAYPTHDSNAGNQYGPGAISGIHGVGEGAAPQFFAPTADIGHPYTTRTASQTYAPSYEWDPSTGQRENQAEQWVAHDLSDAGLHDSGYDVRPRWSDIEYPALRTNVAATAVPFAPVQSPYGVSGGTPDAAARGFRSELYSEPADPAVITGPAGPAAFSEIQGWE